jgi:two-component system, NarL family, invasion response regulator UvrY
MNSVFEVERDSMVRIALADPCPLIRQAFKDVVRKLPEFALQWETGDLCHLKHLLRRHPVDLLTLDPFLEAHERGLSVLRRWRREFPKTWILVYTAEVNDGVTLCALRAGAAGVVDKKGSIKELISALHRIASGQIYLSPTQAREISLQYLSGADAEPHELSPREQEVLEGIAAGTRLKQIAANLSLSPKTVHTYKARIMERFHLKSNADLIRFAEQREEHLLRRKPPAPSSTSETSVPKPEHRPA